MRGTEYCILVVLFIVLSPITANLQEDITKFEVWLDGKNPFPHKKFSFLPIVQQDTTSRGDVGYLGEIKTIASEDIKEKEVIYRYSTNIAFEVPSRAKVEGEEQKKHQKISNSQLALIHLIHESHNEGSEWAPYFNILPKKLSTPLFWTPEELQELRGTSVYTSTVRFNRSLVHEHEDIFSELDITLLYADADPTSIEIYTLDAWRWASSILRTRSWKALGKNMMLPIMDLFNYAKQANVEIISTGEDLEFVAVKDIAKGDKIIINDGVVGNKELLEWYGFVLASNHRDYYPVGVGLDDGDKLFGFKTDLLKQAKLRDGQTFQLKKDHIPQDLILALRIYHVTVYDHSEASAAFEGKIISIQNELEVCETLIDLCESTLDFMPHTMKDDTEILKSNPNLSRNLYSAIILRKSEKSILRSIEKAGKMRLLDVKRGWNYRSIDIPTIRQ